MSVKNAIINYPQTKGDDMMVECENHTLNLLKMMLLSFQSGMLFMPMAEWDIYA